MKTLGDLAKQCFYVATRKQVGDGLYQKKTLFNSNVISLKTG